MMPGSGKHDFLIKGKFGVYAPGKEGSLGSQNEASGIERRLNCTVRRSLRDSSEP